MRELSPKKTWEKLDVPDRKKFLTEVADAAGVERAAWGRLPIEQLATMDYDDLPDDLQGNLIMSWRDGVFSVEEALHLFV